MCFKPKSSRTNVPFTRDRLNFSGPRMGAIKFSPTKMQSENHRQCQLASAPPPRFSRQRRLDWIKTALTQPGPLHSCVTSGINYCYYREAHRSHLCRISLCTCKLFSGFDIHHFKDKYSNNSNINSVVLVV